MLSRLTRFPLRLLSRPLISYSMIGSKQRHQQINESFQEHLKNNWKKFGEASRPHHMSKESMESQHKALSELLRLYQEQDKFLKEFDQDAFIELISQVSYSHANKPLIESEAFQTLIVKTADDCFLFTKVRSFSLFFAFCATQQIMQPELWQNFWGYLKNHHSKFDLEQRLLILDSINKIKSPQFVEFYALFEDEFLSLIVGEKLKMNIILHILQVYQDKGSTAFGVTIRMFIVEKVPEMKIPDMILFLLHYSNMVYDALEDRKVVIEAIQRHLYNIMQFLNIKELTQVFFCFVKTGFGSDVLYRLIEQRVILLMPDMSLKELERLLIIAANKPQILQSIFAAAEQLFKNKITQTKPQDMVQILYLFVEHQQGTKEFLAELEKHLYPSMYTVPIEDLGDLVWSMLNVMKHQEQWLDRLADVVDKRMEEMQVKQLTQFVWMLSDHYKRLKSPESSKFPALFKKISVRLMRHFQQPTTSTIKECALVMSAYVQNYPIPAYLVDLIFVRLLDANMEEMEAWELSTILWGFQYIDNYNPENVTIIYDHLYETTLERMDEMNMYEMLNSVRAYILTDNEENKQELIERGIQKTLQNVPLMDQLEQIYFAVFVFTRTVYQGLKDQDILIECLLQRAQSLQALALTPQPQKDDLDDQVKQYLVNEEVNKIKNGG